MTSNIAPMAFDETVTLVVWLKDSVDSFTHLDGDTLIDIQENGVMVDYSGNRYLVPWSNIKAIRQAV